MWRPQQILDFCGRRYASFLRSLATNDPFFPLNVPFGKPKPTDSHAALAQQVRALVEANLGYQIEWAERNFRLLGRQRLPARIYFENAATYLNAINKLEEAGQFAANLELTRTQLPALLEWIIRHPERTAASAASWPKLLSVCIYFLQNPRPGLYLRELPIEVHTKFVEENKGIIDSLLRHLCPMRRHKPGESFEARYGLRFDEPLVRFRSLDAALQRRLGMIASDLSVPLSQFRQLAWSNVVLIITENKMNFLTLPSTPNSLGIWGGGGAAQLLTSIPWLQHCRLIYWGDIDTHGFHIVSRLRSIFRQLTTVMMDTATLDRCASLLEPAREASYVDTSALSSEEIAAYLRAKNTRTLLEQEKIPYDYALARLKDAIDPTQR